MLEIFKAREGSLSDEEEKEEDTVVSYLLTKYVRFVLTQRLRDNTARDRRGRRKNRKSRRQGEDKEKERMKTRRRKSRRKSRR